MSKKPANNVNFVNKKIANLVTRRDYAKLEPNFEEPNLLEIQKDSYEYFLSHELEEFVKSFFPIKHTKNNIYEVWCEGVKLVKSKRDEETARVEGKTYEKSLFVDLSLVNNETGEIKKSKKTKTNVSDGIFFANIPMMTNNGTFIINGIEKFVISQIVRSPGAYILSKSQIKLNSKKKLHEGYVCELLPAKGSITNFWIDEKNNTINISARNVTGDSAPTFPATQLLKAFGLSQKEILNIFNNNDYIINTLASEKIHHDDILDDIEISGIRKTVNSMSSENDFNVGSPIDAKFKRVIFNFEKINADLKKVTQQYNEAYAKIEEAYQELVDKKEVASKAEKPALEKQMNKMVAPILPLIDRKEKLELEKEKLVDIIITEKAAKDLINLFSISTKSIETILSQDNKTYSYQDILVRHFTEQRQYDMTMAGRYKLNRKLKLSERLYQRIIAEDILDINNKVVFKKGTLMQKAELDEFKQLLTQKKLKVNHLVDLNTKCLVQEKAFLNFERISIYVDNDLCDVEIPILGVDPSNEARTLCLPDILTIISYTINLPFNIGSYDDIDHLGNKRLRLIHEQFKNKLQAGMARVEKQIKDKLASLSIVTINEEQKKLNATKTTIKSVVNTKPFQQVVKAFFNSYQLTQFIDQQNPLSELTNKRRISAMGDGGISREDPNLDIRDVHYSHYGRICPIETPEGMNIGLIMSLASFTKVDDKGFLVTPYRRVIKGQILDKIEWLTASKEDEYIIAESIVECDENFRIVQKKVVGRYRSSLELFDVDQIDYVDVSPRQVVSIAAGAIPFLENDDTTRALMGANMQRQATPLIKPYAPIIGTGSEYKIAHDSGMAIVSDSDGIVKKVDGKNITIKTKDGDVDYKLVKYRKSNQDTCNNQSPIVELEQKITKGQILADGPAMFNGELALGRNPLVAFTTWHGYNFEDAIIVSERLVQEDVYTSIHIDEYTIACLQTKNGDEEISRDLPNVAEDSKSYLDEDGIIMVGAEVKEGDIIVGKISPKGLVDYSPEEKLLNAIFGNKSKTYRDSSLRVPHGGEGTIALVKRFSIINGDELDDEVIELIKVYIVQKRKIQIGDKMAGRHGNKGIISRVVPKEDMPYLEDGTPIDIMLNPLGVPSRMNLGQIMEIHLGLAMFKLAKKQLIDLVLDKAIAEDVSQLFGITLDKTQMLLKVAKKYFTDMKFTQSNKEKIKDVHLSIILSKVGLSFEDLNLKAATPVFHGANLNDIKNAYVEAGIDPIKTKGKFKLIDGRTGEFFPGEITVGVMYMLKLDHMVDDKIHARAVGPYSKITQQPLGGRSQNGGQRFGEMEVWALEAYGAAHNLQEILTIKSDDVKGRNLAYSAIVKGKQIPKSNIPESFKLLTKQLQGLALSINVIDEFGNKEDINNFSSVVPSEDMKKFSSDEAETTIDVKTTEFEAIDDVENL